MPCFAVGHVKGGVVQVGVLELPRGMVLEE